MKRYLGVSLLVALIVITAPACSLVKEQTKETSAQAEVLPISEEEMDAKLRTAAVQASDLPPDYRLTIANISPQDSDIPQNADQGLVGFLLRQFESQGKMTIVNKVLAYKDETAAAQAYELFKQGVLTYSNVLEINGITGDSVGSQGNFKIGSLTQSNASFAFHQGQFIATFLFVNQSGSLDQHLMEKTINLVFQRVQEIN
jgi:hypothetical protein